MYREEREITYSQLSPDKTVSNADILRMFQDIATAHTASCGYNIDKLAENGNAWLIASMHLVIHQPICMPMKAEVSTWTSGFRRAYGFRNFRIRDAKTGKVYAEAASLWIFIDINSGKPCTVPRDIMELYGEEAEPDISYILHKPTWNTDEKITDFRVLKRDLDSNGHMNNTKYIEYAQEALSDTEKPREIEIYYKTPVYYNDKIYLYAKRETDAVLTELKRADGETCVYIKFVL